MTDTNAKVSTVVSVSVDKESGVGTVSEWGELDTGSLCGHAISRILLQKCQAKRP
jgi:hypothetical protein